MSHALGLDLRSKMGLQINYNQRGRYYFFKRLLDFTLAFLLLLIFSLLMVVIAILIKLDSPGPVFYKKQRIGSRRVIKDDTATWEIVNFPCFKFRTMFYRADPSIHQEYVQALIKNNQQKLCELQSGDSSIRKLVHDPRITRVGAILRKFSLDELPQFFNVLRGEMSLVGPRPALQYEVDVYKEWHLDRLKAQPGITGLQQIMARCTADFDDQVKYDLKYIENQSFWLDLKIMLMTPLAVLKHNGAC